MTVMTTSSQRGALTRKPSRSTARLERDVLSAEISVLWTVHAERTI
jgi:hypothetical protein